MLWETPTAKWGAVIELGCLEKYKAQPVRRVWISKDGRPVLPDRSNGRPLGIPTLFDRAVQSLWNYALSPIAERIGDRHSFGFRPYRSTKDAAEMLFIRLGTRHRPTWILEADIEGFFNKISHDWMLQNIPINQSILWQWLKAGHIEHQSVENTDSGVPQGGCISPTISNMVLDGLSAHIKDAVAPYTSKTRITPSKSNTKVTMIRYADDFVVTSAKREILEDVVRPAIEGFLEKRALNLSPKKTVITSLEKGFDFLGYNIRLYNDRKKLPNGKVLLIKPSKKSIERLKNKILLQFDKHKKSSAYTLIHELNPILRGWANYHRTVVAKKVFSKIGYFLWIKAWKWACTKHPSKGSKRGGETVL